MADLQTKFNDLVDVLAAIRRVLELESGNELARQVAQAISVNIPSKADDLSEGSTAEERAEESGAYALAGQAMRIATEALGEATMPVLLPREVRYGKATADYSSGNTVTLTPCLADGTAITPTPSNISAYITFPTDNTQTGYDIEEDDVLAYFPIAPLNSKVGILLPVASSLELPVGTAVGDMLVWNNTTKVWIIKPWIKSVADMQINGTTFKVQVKYTKADGTIDATWTDIHTGTDCDA